MSQLGFGLHFFDEWTFTGHGAHLKTTDKLYFCPQETDLADEMRGHDQVTRAVHPVVIRHPVTGRKVLYVNGAFTLHFDETNSAASQSSSSGCDGFAPDAPRLSAVATRPVPK